MVWHRHKEVDMYGQTIRSITRKVMGVGGTEEGDPSQVGVRA